MRSRIRARITSQNGDFVVDGIYTRGSAPTPGGTEQWMTGDPNNFIRGASQAATATTTTMSWSWSTSGSCAHAGAAVIPFTVAGPKAGTLTTLGVGK